MENDRAVEQLKKGCRKVSVVIYQTVDDSTPAAALTATTKKTAAPKMPAAKTAEKGLLPAFPRKKSEPLPASPGELRPTPGVPQFAVDFRESVAENAFAPTYTDMAALNLQAVSANGLPLPKWFVEEFHVKCTVFEFPSDGVPRSRELINASKPKTCNITAGTSQLAVRFWFLRKSLPAGHGNRPTAETSWHVVETVARGAEYRLKAPLTQEMLGSLQAKASKPP